MMPPGALTRARAHLASGRSVGIFPEGTVNRDPGWLLSGHRGAAYLSLATGTPVIPVGIRFPGSEHRIADHARMQVTIGAPLVPPREHRRRPSHAELCQWHSAVMGEIGRLSGKTWSPEGDQRCPDRAACLRRA